MSIRHLRRKPGNRCVILYELTLTHPRASQQQLLVCGKVYTDREQARRERGARSPAPRIRGKVGSVLAGQTVRSPLVPRPLGMVEDLGLLLSEMVEPDADPWKPRITQAPGGEPSDLNLPAQELLCAATAMARLHGSRTPIFAAAPRTSSGEVEKMRERAAPGRGESRAG